MICKLSPLFFEKVWGGSKLKSLYNYDCSDKTGEAWGISGHKNGSSIISNGQFKGWSLRELYNQKPELFGSYPSNEFPILIKVIDAMEDLSIQVHPDDEYARKFENSLGKTECWHILETEPNTEIIIGHKAKNLEEFKDYVKNNDFESVLNKFPIKKNDEFNIYAGTIHAICKGTLLLEIQQSSDITYRLYDYNRLSNGKLRELHLDKAFDVIKFPDYILTTEKPINLFDFHIIDSKISSQCQADEYGDYIFIMEGYAKFDDFEVRKGDFLFIPANEKYEIKGSVLYFVAHIKK
jgi:mannose-6-phosphate isomerase class I